jgi:hypothetical protein
MNIHSVYFNVSIQPPGKTERHHYLMSVDAPTDQNSTAYISPRYVFDTDQIGVKIWDKEKTKCILVPWAQISQIKYVENTDVKKVTRQAT